MLIWLVTGFTGSKLIPSSYQFGMLAAFGYILNGYRSESSQSVVETGVMSLRFWCGGCGGCDNQQSNNGKGFSLLKDLFFEDVFYNINVILIHRYAYRNQKCLSCACSCVGWGGGWMQFFRLGRKRFITQRVVS